MADPKGLLILAVQDKMRNNGKEPKPEYAPERRLTFLTERVTDKCEWILCVLMFLDQG